MSAEQRSPRDLGRELAERTTREQGLALHVADRTVLRRVAQLVVALLPPDNADAIDVESVPAANSWADRHTLK